MLPSGWGNDPLGMSTATPPGTSDLPPLDPDALARLRRFGGAKLLNEMIVLYVQTAAGRLAAAEAGLSAGNASATANALHSLKSSSAQLGAARLSELCEQGETIAIGGTLSGVAAILEASREELGRVECWLESVRRGPLP
jgi:two-component system sensor histidine kinase BarA